MPESRQIGRRAAIDRLETRVRTAGHQWVIGPRRIGKTSVAKAVLARLRARGLVALDVDLSKLTIKGPESLAGEIARQAQAAEVGGRRDGRLRTIANRQRPTAKRLSGALRELGYEGEAQALAVAASVLAGADDGSPGLCKVLQALALHAHGTAKHVVLLLDEVHHLGELSEAAREVAAWCREEACPIVFLFAGSEEAAVNALRRDGEPLARIGQEFELGEIGREDWVYGLRRRFAEARIELSEAGLLQILEASEGHPRRTMLICSYVHSSAIGQPDRVAGEVLLELAIRGAREDRAWI